LRTRLARPSEARAQAVWIVAMEPWLSLGYRAQAFGRYLGRMARAGQVLVAVEKMSVVGISVCQPDFLLGQFIALLAVRPEAGGKGIGRALVKRLEQATFRKRRWLYVSSDGENRAAGLFYRKLGFARLARIPDLIQPGRTEILWRKGRDQPQGPFGQEESQ
jgi:ribosomal protein S18 acetylase RimI-like enzyme